MMKKYFISYIGIGLDGLSSIFGNVIYESNAGDKPTYDNILDWEEEIKHGNKKFDKAIILNFIEIQ